MSRAWLPVRQRSRYLAARFIDRLADTVAQRLADTVRVLPRSALDDADLNTIAYRTALELLLNHSTPDKKPNEVFSGISDEFWFWLLTEGLRRNASLRRVLPGLPDEDTQLMFTGNTGDVVLREAFTSYQLFKSSFETQVGPIADANILDFGVGYGRLIRFFLKDVDPSRLWGIDPSEEMIALCKQNRWGHFETNNLRPPSRFDDETFDLIYSFSVFSHFSEEIHNSWLVELTRILKPGGLFIATTRSREFIESCAALRTRTDLDSFDYALRVTAGAFPDTFRALDDYDRGEYCHSQIVQQGEWSYWGDTAVPRSYVLKNWTDGLTFVDYIDDRSRCVQNIIIMKKL